MRSSAGKRYPAPVRARWLAVATLVGGCVAPNPAYSPGESSGGGDGAESQGKVTSGSSKGTTGVGEGSGGATSSSLPPTTSASTHGGTAADPTHGPLSTSTTGWGSSGGVTSSTSLGSTGRLDTGPPVLEDMGFPCPGDCEDVYPGAECCEADQCLGTCMLPCEENDECPPSMLCAHDYCLFQCADDNDADCAWWPGFTCQHNGTLCENDDMD